MGAKADLYRAKAACCEERAKNERHKNAREWQLTLARVYQVLAIEAENAAQQLTVLHQTGQRALTAPLCQAVFGVASGPAWLSLLVPAHGRIA
jgi:hypothetical protein